MKKIEVTEPEHVDAVIEEVDAQRVQISLDLHRLADAVAKGEKLEVEFATDLGNSVMGVDEDGDLYVSAAALFVVVGNRVRRTEQGGQ